MARMPSNTRSLTGLGEYGVDPKGEKVFFSLVMSRKGRATFLADHKGLADTIHYLQQIAQRAEELRMATLKEDHVQVLPIHSQVIRKGSLVPDVTGQLARLEATTPSGLPVEFQLEFGVLVSLQERLPDLIEKMRELQDRHKSRRPAPLGDGA